MCGVDLRWPPPWPRFCGSSPHAWGRFLLVFESVLNRAVHPHMRGADVHIAASVTSGLRFIPTCVGQITPTALHRYPASVHPHMRGADWALRARCVRPRTVHPHMRGADAYTAEQFASDGGSSPHALGRYLLGVVHRRHFRFIPTCVGQMRLPAGQASMHSVHPHMRGADLISGINPNVVFGSSPHAWGRWTQRDAYIVCPRFIPTCVGQMRCGWVGWW